MISSPAEAKVSVFDRGFLFGDGVYETGRSYDKCFLFLEEHLTRLRLSAYKLGIRTPWSDEEITGRLNETARAFGESNVYFRVIVTRGGVPYVGLDVDQNTPPTLVIIVQSLSAKTDEVRARGVALLTSKIVRNSADAQDPNIKTSNYLNSLLALNDVRARGGEDAILCTRDGVVTEGTTFSIFGYSAKDNRLFTPSLAVGILDSITRRHVIEVARPRMTIDEGAFPLAEFLAADEIFMASSVREVVPVRSWDGKSFPVPGERTPWIHGALRESIREYVQKHPKF